MKALVQRVSYARVSVGGEIVGEIGRGLLILLGIGAADTPREAAFVADKCANLRIFEDNAGKMNLSLLDIGGEALVISQFTLYGDASHGRRPSFSEAAPPELAEPLYKKFVELLEMTGLSVATGRFRAEMAVELCNDGPVTIMVESR